MSISRMLAVAALLATGAFVVSTPACVAANDLENGQECIHSNECGSQMCVQGVCKGINGDACQHDEGCASGKCVDGKCTAYLAPAGDTGVSDAGGDSGGEVSSDAPSEVSTEAGSDADDGAVDTGSSAETATDAGASD
jgi:hypothetical protein